MNISELDFDLPEDLIARYPPDERRQSKLLVARASEQQLQHAQFSQLADFFEAGDLLVLNDTKVVPALLQMHKQTGGKIEMLFLRAEAQVARCMLSGSRIRVGQELFSEDNQGRVTLIEKLPRGEWLVELRHGDWHEYLRQHGRPPLPPYIRRMRSLDDEDEIQQSDFERYQTIWAKNNGSIAAPTASLHFDELMLQQLQQQKVDVGYLSLHVGQGTFLPVSCEQVEDHPIHSESFEINNVLAEKITAVRKRGNRVFAGGTTVCRALEAWAVGHSVETDLMILPGHDFQVVDALLTNFHTPRSTLLALVAALAEQHGAPSGIKFIKNAYVEAISHGYKFYSYGDASLWLPPKN
ncbi:MAG: tRNA preQ1(34) S-adenosylmethionine ribosyltransferase-isomerase QueA [Planctomycetes bacterium]|nr:tRNA preQ1(34) S-adenosylmethionine ribosyltransferase-isomerase QueA [Planctomycetota bacterium]